jgi:carbon starvation protein CstA
LVFSLAAPSGFQVIWQYFSWANQLLAAFTLWAVTVYLRRNKTVPYYWMSLIPALFMTMVTVSFLFISPACLGAFIPRTIGYVLAAIITTGTAWRFFAKEKGCSSAL